MLEVLSIKKLKIILKYIQKINYMQIDNILLFSATIIIESLYTSVERIYNKFHILNLFSLIMLASNPDIFSNYFITFDHIIYLINLSF